MYGAYRVETIRRAEAAAMALGGDDLLMQRAAAGLAAIVGRELRARRGKTAGARVLLIVGSGNNGGDGLYAAVKLARRGVTISAWRAGSSVHAAAWDAFRAAGGRELTAAEAVAELPRAALLIDAVVGIGGRGGLRPDIGALARAAAALGVPVVAVDLPSGVPPEPPWPAGFDGSTTDGKSAAFAATVTVTFGGHKLCHVIEPARSACGRVDLVDIGLRLPAADLWCWTPPDVAAAWPVPGPLSDKYSRGVVGIDAGSRGYPGAAVLATAGAVGAGAGMVRFTGDPQVAQRVIDRFPSVVPGVGQVQARVLGCGWGERPDAARLVAEALDSGVPAVVDADALRHLPTGALGPQVLLTPHAGELSRLLSCDRAEVVADPVAAVTAASARHGATVLLKGATQFVASLGASVQVAVPGPGWTAQAGSGDVLAGICGALMAAGVAAPEAAGLAASIQAMTARGANSPLSPDRIAHLIPVRIGAILRPSPLIRCRVTRA